MGSQNKMNKGNFSKVDPVGESYTFYKAQEPEAKSEKLTLSIFQVQSGQTKGKIKLFFACSSLFALSQGQPSED